MSRSLAISLTAGIVSSSLGAAVALAAAPDWSALHRPILRAGVGQQTA